MHLELVRLQALGHRHIALDLDEVPVLNDDAVADIVAWHRVLAARDGRLSFVREGPVVADRLRQTEASSGLEEEEDWSIAAGFMSFGTWARMRRKQS